MEKIGKKIRSLNFIREDGRTFIVAMDHAVLGITEGGIEDIVGLIKKVKNGGADAVLVNVGAVRKIAENYVGKIGIVLSIPFDDPKYVEFAAKLGVDAVKTTYFGSLPLTEERYIQFTVIGRACEEWEIPWIAEVVPTNPEGKTIYDVNVIKKAARIGSEFGGDFVKTGYAGTVEEYREVVRSSLAPIVVMGGPKMDSDRAVLQMIKNSVDAGAIGGVIGRNVWQHADPTKMSKAISSIIHENIDVEEASNILK